MNFPVIQEDDLLPLRRMSAMEYCRFCEACIRMNPLLTPENCMNTRLDEAEMDSPFRLIPDEATKR